MNLFAKACGATGLLQLHVENIREDDAGLHTFDAPFLTIGRDPQADLNLTHRGVSRRHAYLQIVSGRLYCRDLGSRMGTYLGGECLRGGWVGRRQVIRIGPYRLRLDEGDRDPSGLERDREDSLPSRSTSVSALPRLFLELWDRSSEPSVWQVEQEMALIGNSADCEVPVLDPGVSKYHCSLLRTPMGIWVVDLLGMDGVMVNGTAVRYARVYDGDELHLGHSLIRLRYEMPRDLSASASLPAGAHRIVPGLTSPKVPARVAHELWQDRDRAISVRTPADVPSPAQTSGPLIPEWIPQGAEAASPGAELLRSIVFPMMDKFGQVQQQVLDEFQQSMMGMLRTFTTVQNEQAENLRREFDQLRSLTQELTSLRGELKGAALPSPSPAGPAADPVAADLPPMAVPAPPELGEVLLRGSRRAPSPPQTRPAEPAAKHPEALPHPGEGRVAPAPGGAVAEEEGRASGPNPKDKEVAAIHEQLFQRIMENQKQQRDSWLRIFKMMPGRGEKKPAR